MRLIHDDGMGTTVLVDDSDGHVVLRVNGVEAKPEAEQRGIIVANMESDHSEVLIRQGRVGELVTEVHPNGSYLWESAHLKSTFET